MKQIYYGGKKISQILSQLNHYNEPTGACNYINENVKEYPSRFIKYCDGKYLSLIEGRSIQPVQPIQEMPVQRKNDDDDYIIPDMVTVFALNNYPLFQMAKNLLKSHGIKFWSNSEYTGFTLSLTRNPYTSQIRVRSKDEKAARKILSELEESDAYVPSNKSDRKIKNFVARWGIPLIILSLVIIFLIFFLFGKKFPKF